MIWDVLINSGRRMGKTTVMAKAAKEIGAVLLVHNAAEAKRVEAEHHTPACALDQVEKLRGTNKPLLVDPTAVGFALNNLEGELQMLRSVYAEAQRKHEANRINLKYCFHKWVVTDPYPEHSAAQRMPKRGLFSLKPKDEPPKVSIHQAWMDGFNKAKKLVEDELARQEFLG